jgi:hypothetical protein
MTAMTSFTADDDTDRAEHGAEYPTAWPGMTVAVLTVLIAFAAIVLL